MKNISRGTIVRTIMLVVVVLNLILKQLGYDPFNIEEVAVAELVEMIISIGTIVACYWKNNSVSKEAIAADEFFKRLKNEEE